MPAEPRGSGPSVTRSSDRFRVREGCRSRLLSYLSSDLRGVVRTRLLVSVAVSGDRYSLGYSVANASQEVNDGGGCSRQLSRRWPPHESRQRPPDTTAYQLDYGKDSVSHALCTACSSRASLLPGGKSNEETDRLHARRYLGRDHGNYRLRQRWQQHHHHHGSQRSSLCSHHIYGQERLPLRPCASQRRVLP